MSSPYEVERTTHYLGRSESAEAKIPNDLIITMVHLADTEYFELFVNSDQVGAIHKDDNPVMIALKHLSVNGSL